MVSTVKISPLRKTNKQIKLLRSRVRSGLLQSFGRLADSTTCRSRQRLVLGRGVQKRYHSSGYFRAATHQAKAEGRNTTQNYTFLRFSHLTQHYQKALLSSWDCGPGSILYQLLLLQLFLYFEMRQRIAVKLLFPFLVKALHGQSPHTGCG